MKWFVNIPPHNGVIVDSTVEEVYNNENIVG